jgi:hypothetical protein
MRKAIRLSELSKTKPTISLIWRNVMKVKTNVRAGKGGASGVGKNSKGMGVDLPEVEVQSPPPVSRCVGI